MKYLFFILIAFSFVSCETNEDAEVPVVADKPDETPKGTLEEQLIAHIKSELNITAIEKYDYTVYKEELNRDDSTDWIITVNLLDRAINQSIENDNTAKMAELGFMGSYNYIIFMDGQTKKFSPAIVIPSSAPAKLIVGFENISSLTDKDFVVDLKIRNSRRRRFYTIVNNLPMQMCESVIYYNLGKANTETESYVIDYVDSELGPFKDIVVYEGVLEQRTFDNTDEIYTFEPTVESSGNIAHIWHFSPQKKMFYINKGEI